MDPADKLNAPNGDFGGKKVWSLTISYDTGRDQFDIQGLDVPPWIALGLLEYASILIRRRDVENAVHAAVQNRPRVIGPMGRG